MKSNELRIGNWIEDKEHFKGYFQVESIAKYTVQSPDWTLELDEVGPIPLTEEWLIKFGAIYPYQDHRLQIGNLCFSYDNMLGLFLNDSGFNEAISNSIKNVNQLQNIYFDLTGNELTIKP